MMIGSGAYIFFSGVTVGRTAPLAAGDDLSGVQRVVTCPRDQEWPNGHARFFQALFEDRRASSFNWQVVPQNATPSVFVSEGMGV